MVCHGELAGSKPHPDYLTNFYLSIAGGGALGGLLVGLVAPQVFNGYWELPLALVALAWLGFYCCCGRAGPSRASWLLTIGIASLATTLCCCCSVDFLHRHGLELQDRAGQRELGLCRAAAHGRSAVAAIPLMCRFR